MTNMASILISSTSTSPSLDQGNKYCEKKENVIEGLTSANTLVSSTNKVVGDNTLSNTDSSKVDALRKQYNDTLKEYNDLVAKISGNVNTYIDRVNPANKYLNKVIRFSSNQFLYVTNQGVAKRIPSDTIWNSTNIPRNATINVNIPWDNKYSTPGTTIPTTPSLVSGTPVLLNQQFGNEGSNVFVNEFIAPNTKPTYMGCYSGGNNNDTMTFIGPVPPKTVLLTNGNFSEPSIKNNSHRDINDGTSVPGWFFRTSILANNSTIWGLPIPYPKGDQCAIIKRAGFIYTTLALNTGVNYVLSFYACGRPCCAATRGSNPIDIKLHTSDNAFISTISRITADVRVWKQYTVNFTVPTTRSYRLYFNGTSPLEDRSTGLQGITITNTLTGNGNYTVSDCMKSAASQGYQYFALQDVNTQTSKGFCAVSNSVPDISRHGISKIPSQSVQLWSSNTPGNQSSTATLTNTGSLQVINSNRTIYSSPASNALPSNYLGCYSDPSGTAMTYLNNGAETYNYTTCKEAATSGKYSLFALQNPDGRGQGKCAVSNNQSTAMQYGIARNCTKPTDKYRGGALSNAIYNTTLTTSNYYLMLYDDGNMVINRGTSPDDNQGQIWSSNTTGKQLQSNSRMRASEGKYGRNWLRNGEVLAAGEFVGSPSGKIALVMKPDGNLVLNTYQMEENCLTMKDNNKGGGINANAAYNIGVKSVPKAMGQLAYIDADSNLYAYPDTNKKYGETYTVLSNLNTLGNDISRASFANATVDTCKTACNRRTDCAGFVFDKTNKVCYPKSKNMYPYGTAFNSNSNTDIYVRNIIPVNPPKGVSGSIANVNSFQFSNYKNSGKMKDQYGLANANIIEKQQLQQLQSRMDMLSAQIKDYTNKFSNGSMQVQQQSTTNTNGVNDFVKNIKDTNNQITQIGVNESTSLQNILNDSDIVTLQRNYEYLFWSILAAGSVLITMNVVKK